MSSLLLAHGSRAAQTTIQFDVSGNLGDALRRFSEQSGLQLLYEQELVRDKTIVPLHGRFTSRMALDALLKDSGLSWRYINDQTVAVVRAQPAASPPPLVTGVLRVAPKEKRPAEITELSDVDINNQQRWWTELGHSTMMGFDKPLLETPRWISFVSGDAIETFSLSAVEDLLRVVPGVFTTTRFGVQGSVDIRNIPADTYFRGMKRLTLQGHGRSVFAAMDSIEVVGGPASPLYGLGKIGGYTNVVPKSGRAKTGQYLTDTQGFVQLVGGEYDRREGSFGVGGPLSFMSNRPGPLAQVRGGYYVYGLVEDSGSYAEGVPVKQKVLQAATSIDGIFAPLRLETGINYQESRTAGALTGRLTQRLVDDDVYIGGMPLVNLDLNGSGSIGYLEMQRASPVTGALTTNNQPLNQVFSWPKNAGGQYLNLDQFPKRSGIPQAMYEYLQSHPEADPDGALRAQGVGGPVPISGAVPVGMVLDPRTVTYRTYNPRHSAAFENHLKAQFFTAFLDLINDRDANFTYKNQLFFDSMNQYKSSNQPFSQVQDVYVIEDKFTLTHRLDELPAWLRVNGLLTANARHTVSSGKMTLADYGNHRTDATSENWNNATAGMTANTTFISSNEDASYASGQPWTSVYRTQVSEFGVGLLFDVDLFSRTNVLLGGRIDTSQAQNIDYAGRFNINTGTAANPGAFYVGDDVARAWDGGTSWSLSVSQQLPYGLRPYLTLSRASILLDSNNNSLLNSVIRAGHVGVASLQEAGIKASSFQGKLVLASAVYQQGREDVSTADDPTVLNVYATATTTRGWQAELKWLPIRDLVVSMYALRQITRYTPNIGGLIQVDARALGFTDVRDAMGNIIYPAEAFLYGGRARIMLPNGLKQYERKQGNPENQVGMTVIYQFSKHWGATLKGNYLSGTCAGRLCLVKLPQSRVLDAGLFWSNAWVDIKLDVFNLNNEHYFRARTGDTLGDVIAQTMPGRRWQVTARYRF